MKVTMIMFMGLQVADGFLTMWATSNGFIEVNPLMMPIAHTWMMPLQKILVAKAGVAVICVIVRRYPALIAPIRLSLVLSSSLVTLVLVSNLIQLAEGTWGL